MSELSYWKWQAFRNLPLAVAVFAVVSAIGITVIRILPQKQIAASRLVLETPLALNETPRAARSAQDVQHLQVVTHQLLSQPSFKGTVEATIKSGRDKPTNLVIEAHATSEKQALTLSFDATTFAIEASNKLQRKRIEASLANLQALVEKQAAQVATAQEQDAVLSTTDAAALDAKLASLNQQASNIAAKLTNQPSSISTPNPALAALQRELSKAKAIYSDKHPKVRLLHARIDTISNVPAVEAQDLAPVRARQDDLRKEIAQITKTQATQMATSLALSDAQNRLTQSKDALIAARLQGERSVARLKVVENAATQTASREKKQMALFATLALIAIASALAAAVLRVKMDRRLRRPQDLTRTLGLTPFATIPHLGSALT